MSTMPLPIATSIGRKILKSVNKDFCADVGVSSSKFAASGLGVAVGVVIPAPVETGISVLFGFGAVVDLIVGTAVGNGVGLTVGVGVGLAVEVPTGPVAILKLNGIITEEAAALGLLSGAVGATACCLNW